jgi:hypothetical protein
MKRWLVRIALGLLALFALIQLVPAGRTNPPATGPIGGPPEALAVLRRACFDCHSNETRWPWYAYVAPVSWLVVRDVEQGREHLNFSVWGGYSAKKRISAADEAAEEAEKGSMPLSQYLWMHPDARLSPADVQTLRRWAEDVD